MMIIENSSKCYPQLYNAKNQQINSLQIIFLGETKLLTNKDFFDRTQLLNLDNVPDLKLQGMHQILFDEKNLFAFHIFLYYCIKVDSGIQMQGLDNYYLSQLGNFYIQKSFRIDIGKFAQMCSYCIKINLRKCLHTIYFLVYGRLATNSYINAIIAQLHSGVTSKNDRIKALNSTKSIFKKENKDSTSRTQKKESQVYQSAQICADLIQDLNQIFHKNDQNTIDKNNFKIKGSNVDNDDLELIENKQNTLKSKISHYYENSQNKYYMSFFPNRVFNSQKSAIFQRMMPTHRINYKLMRKKKYDDSKIQKMLYMTFNVENELQMCPKNIKNDQKTLINKQRNKIFTHNIVKTNERFKNSSCQLDKIRGMISNEKIKKKTIVGTQQKQYTCQSQRQYLEMIKKKAERSLDQQKIQVQDINNFDYQNQNKFTSLTRKEQKFCHKSKKNSECRNNNKEMKVPNNFTTSHYNIKTNKTALYTQCQNRVTQYKNEYRRFMKLHLFRADDDSKQKII